MPKKFTDTDKRKWLELYESGKTEKWIAREHARCDARTIKRGIEEARRKQDARVARAELLKNALRKHQDSLLDDIDRIFSTLTVPPEDFAVLSWYANDNSVFAEPGTVAERQVSDISASSSVPGSQGEAVRKLLKEHLKNDRLWKELAQWEKAYSAHLATKVALQRRTITLLQEKTGLKFTDKNDVPRPFLYSYTAGDLFFKAVIKHAFGTQKGTDLERDITVNTDSGDVKYHGSILAETAGNTEEIKANLLDAFQELKASPEVIPVVDTYVTLKKITIKASQVIEQIRLLGLIPGQCEICRRLGM